MIARRKHDWMRKADPALRGVRDTEDDYSVSADIFSVSTADVASFISRRESRGNEHLMEPGHE